MEGFWKAVAAIPLGKIRCDTETKQREKQY